MTELEALAKDCIENHTHRLVDKPTKQDIYLREESIFIQGYRQSEKRIAELEKENKELRESVTKFSKNGLDFLHSIKSNRNCFDCESKMSIQLNEAKEIMKIAIEGIKHWGIIAGKERPFEKQAEMLFNLFLDKAEQFIK